METVRKKVSKPRPAISARVEREFKRVVLDLIACWKRKAAIYELQPVAGRYSEAGHADIFIVCRGRVLALEVKRDSNNAHEKKTRTPRKNEAAQAIQKERLLAAGGDWLVVSPALLEKFVSKMEVLTQIRVTDLDAVDSARVAKVLSAFAEG